MRGIGKKRQRRPQPHITSLPAVSKISSSSPPTDPTKPGRLRNKTLPIYHFAMQPAGSLLPHSRSFPFSERHTARSHLLDSRETESVRAPTYILHTCNLPRTDPFSSIASSLPARLCLAVSYSRSHQPAQHRRHCPDHVDAQPSSQSQTTTRRGQQPVSSNTSHGTALHVMQYCYARHLRALLHARRHE